MAPLTQIEIKRLYRFFNFREYLHNIDTSGLYPKKLVYTTAIATGINYNTLKSDINFFSSKGLVIQHGQFIKLNRITGEYHRIYKLWVNYKTEIKANCKPAIYLSDLYKRKIVFSNVIAQAKKEVEKINDKNLKSKYLRIVKGHKTPIGAKQGIYLSLDTIGKVLGRCKATAWKYVERLHQTGIMERVKNKRFVCELRELVYARSAENLYGRLTVKDGKVYERSQNSYFFN